MRNDVRNAFSYPPFLLSHVESHRTICGSTVVRLLSVIPRTRSVFAILVFTQLLVAVTYYTRTAPHVSSTTDSG
ncbi:hypothetical protein LSAT2_001597 [Lamellibrachia satsuma]|nr:hypothetical protein LSAT2_001597 [Lamellibrachia satsuma]